jgi:phytoene synthase
MDRRAADEHVTKAYRECERITRTQARNFSWGISLLPAGKRTALSAVYAMARRIDDIGDGALPAEEKLQALHDARAVATAPHTRTDDLVAVALADAADRLPIPLAAFGELVDGCEMDVAGRSYDTIDDLVEYCRCVAGSIGRLSLGVFAPPLSEPAFARAADLADSLGVALQLTNILRDLLEDLRNGRVYLPKQDLALFGCELRLRPDGTLDPQGGAVAEVIRFEAARAWGWYARGLPLLRVLDRRSAGCCAAMAGIYSELLDRIAAEPDRVLTGRVSVPTRTKLTVATTALLRAGAQRRTRGPSAEVSGG